MAMARRAWSPAFTQIHNIKPWEIKKLTIDELNEIRNYQPVPVI